MSGNTGQHITVEMVVCCPVFCVYEGDHTSKSGLALISTPVLNYRQARKWFSPISRSRKFIEIFVAFRPGFCYNLIVSLCSCAGGKEFALACRYMR